MYDRAPRNLVNCMGSTGDQVGPGTYDADVIDPKRLRADGYAPFLSMTSRDTFLNPSDQVIAAPGPGQYDPLVPQANVKGGRTLANKSRRFNEQPPIIENPGPGAYTLSKKSDWIKETGRKASSAPSAMDKNKGMLVTNRIKFHRKPVAPSIPTPGQSYGYEENDDGTLRKQDPPEKDASLGPAFYMVKEEQLDATRLYRGPHFGRLTAKRMDFAGKDGPGPGEYEPYKGGAEMIVEHLNIQQEGGDRTRFDAKIPRYHELVVKDEEKKAVPGPGKYEMKGQFEPNPPRVNTEGIEVEHPPFMSQAKRFSGNKTTAPAPGSYNDPRTALDELKKITGLKRSPFGQTSVRFHGDRKPIPGPGAYNISGMGSDSMRRAYIESTRRGAFGTTAVRIQPMNKKDAPAQPGPAHYQVKEKMFEPRYQQQLTSNFASLSNRLTEQNTKQKEMPPPGSYEVAHSYAKSQGKAPPAAPRTDAAKKKQGAFQSSSSRFAPPRDVVLKETDPAYPGPGTYQPSSHDRHGNPMIAKESRFKDVKMSDTPGPGAYEYSPLIQDTVLKGTFNATLNNPIAKQFESFDTRMSANQPFLLGV